MSTERQHDRLLRKLLVLNEEKEENWGKYIQHYVHGDDVTGKYYFKMYKNTGKKMENSVKRFNKTHPNVSIISDCLPKKAITERTFDEIEMSLPENKITGLVTTL